MSRRGPELIAELRRLVGPRHVFTGRRALAYETGYRSGHGSCLAAVQPGSLIEQWRVLQACVAADVVIILQAANTGLTGGSTPDGDDYDRPVVIVSTRRLRGVQPIEGGREVVCLPGATLDDLERRLESQGREPHSVIGSSCIGASVLGGICNNSGGALVRRGPAFTQMALFAQLDVDRRLRLVNHLGIDLGEDPEEILQRLQSFDFGPADVRPAGERLASDRTYASRVRDIEAATPARFNADPATLFEASGCAGKLAVFAVRLDTFEREADTTLFYIGVRDPSALSRLRRALLRDAPTLPILGEYMHRDAFALAARYGKDMFLAINALGAHRLPLLLKVKAAVDGLFPTGARASLADRVMLGFAKLWPQHLPARMRDFQRKYEHHLLVRMDAAGADFLRRYLAAQFDGTEGDHFECDPAEAAAALLHRFVMAGAAMRYSAVHGQPLIALDIALPRNAPNWFETLPTDLAEKIALRLYYGHFFCHVFHQDYVLEPGQNPDDVKAALLETLAARGAQYPAEHNVGHLYKAPDPLAGFYKDLDPCNQFNPGIGRTSKRRDWEPDQDACNVTPRFEFDVSSKTPPSASPSRAQRRSAWREHR